jgi:hypothetical protein
MSDETGKRSLGRLMQILSATSILIASITLAGCVSSGERRPVPEAHASPKVRQEIASAVYRTAPKWSGLTKVVDATISTPYVSRKFGTGQEYTQYCVTGAIEMPILNRYFYSDVEVYEEPNGQYRVSVRTTNNARCPGLGSNPFPELEAVSQQGPVIQ